MPKVTEEHRAARREQILDAAMRCVAREGFHKTTMADVIAESGLSAGAVYGYFKSKTELIQALADRAVGSFAGGLRGVADGPGPVTVNGAVATLLANIDGLVAETQGAAPLIAVHAWSEAARDSDVADILRRRIGLVHDAWIAVLARAEADGTIPAGRDHALLARGLLGVTPGYLVQGPLLGLVDAETYLASVEAMLGLTAPNG